MCEEKQASADVQETALAELDKNILLILLKDRSTGKNILGRQTITGILALALQRMMKLPYRRLPVLMAI